METDKRKDERFLVGEEVIVALRNRSSRVGRVKDISMGGLSFEHIYDEDLEGDASRREVSLWVDDYSMPDIPCRVVYDIPISESPEYDYLSVHFKSRRCGIQFDLLTKGQKDQLDFFIKTRTKGKV
ncbi:MAG: PilZ domain-containing protein [Thermodesulfobacteriota bacterium]